MREATWESKLAVWSVGPGKTEEEKMERAETAIRKAIDASASLDASNIEVLATGSYKNRTHIKAESDVDVAVIYDNVFVSNWYHVDKRALGDETVRRALMEEAGIHDVDYRFADYKNEVEEALVARFGREAVERGEKAFDIHENTYRVESDCLAAWKYRLWLRNASGALYSLDGRWFRTDPGDEIFNYPKQQRANGQAKHERTQRRFRKLVRIIKNLAIEMAEAGIKATEPIPSFLIESLVYQVPDDEFGYATFYAELRSVLAWLFNNTMSGSDCSGWTEVNEIKLLFHASQPWDQQQAHAFIDAAWEYVGFE